MSGISPGPKQVILNGKVVGEYFSTGDIEKDIEAARNVLKINGLYKEISLFQAIYN